jgi:L-gamma-glutamyl-L-propargylglycine hydroxylase
VTTSAQALPDSSTQRELPTDTLFRYLVADRLAEDHLVKLGAGIIGAVRIPNFFTTELCESIMTAFADCPLGSYDEELIGIRLPKLGPAAFDYYQDGAFSAGYWTTAEQSAALRAGLGDQDPLELAVSRLAEAWPRPVRRLTAGGRPLFAGMIREINEGAGIHYDELAREFPDAADETPIAQIAFNCHLSTRESGGELNVFRRRWQPADEISHGDGYFYPGSLLDREQFVSVRASTGDAVLFDSRNYHRILPGEGAGRRVTLSFFVGLSSTGALVLWS